MRHARNLRDVHPFVVFSAFDADRNGAIDTCFQGVYCPLYGGVGGICTHVNRSANALSYACAGRFGGLGQHGGIIGGYVAYNVSDKNDIILYGLIRRKYILYGLVFPTS